jgi:hypothetical protein
LGLSQHPDLQTLIFLIAGKPDFSKVNPRLAA